MPKSIRYLLLLLLLAAVPLAMQFRGGAIEGTVTNEAGPVAGAVIEARNVMTGEQTQAVSNADGRYRVEDLRTGRYSLWVRAERHTAVWVPQIVVEQGQSVQRDVRLSRTRQTSEVREPGVHAN